MGLNHQKRLESVHILSFIPLIPNMKTKIGFANVELDEFFDRFEKHSSDCLRNAYLSKRCIEATHSSNHLITTLPSDIFTVVNYDLKLVTEYIQSHPDTFLSTDAGFTFAIELARISVTNLIQKQKHFRNNFYDSLEGCCAAANDLLLMVDCVDGWMDEFVRILQLDAIPDRPLYRLLQRERQECISLYGCDSVYSAQMAHTFVMDTFHEHIAKRLFTREWEMEYVQNQVAQSMVKTMDDFYIDVKQFLMSDYLLKKFLDALMASLVTFLVKHLLLKLKKNLNLFKSPRNAARRMSDDFDMIRRFFDNLREEIPGLKSSIQRELRPLEAILEFVTTITKQRDDKCGIEKDISLIDVRPLALVMNRFTGKMKITQYFMSDLTLLFSERKHSTLRSKQIIKMVSRMHDEFDLVQEVSDYRYYSPMDSNQRLHAPVLRLDKFFEIYYDNRLKKERPPLLPRKVSRFRQVHESKETSFI